MTDAEFEAFVRRYEDVVFATAVRLLGNRTEAEDVAQTVFLKAFERFEQIGTSPTAGGWLKTVTTNLCLNHLSRYRKRWRLFSELAREGESTDDVVAEAVGPDRAVDVERADEAMRIGRALADLPDHQRVPLVLFHFEGLSYQEIAAVLHVSQGKLKTDMHRARLALKGVLGA
jgi:RNA polymerase sigma-70 factor (ECF subfamily)